jgi:RimJ/RimL family protein N-acetyltransferase
MLPTMLPAFDPRPVPLEGHHVRLEPMERRHLPALLAVAGDPETFRYFLTRPLGEEAEMTQWMEGILKEQAAGNAVGWVTVRRADNCVVGATTYLDIRRVNRGLEIGNTWIAPQAQRTAVNTEAKYLQLRHAFESLGAWRVQLKTDERNVRSREAIARLGCTFEGILRRYQLRSDGFVRNTAMFSLLDHEWPAAKAALEARLSR